MPVKIFQACGHDEIKGLDEQINAWLKTMATHSKGVVKQMDTKLTSITESDSDDLHPYVVVAIRYEEPN